MSDTHDQYQIVIYCLETSLNKPAQYNHKVDCKAGEKMMLENISLLGHERYSCHLWAYTT